MLKWSQNISVWQLSSCKNDVIWSLILRSIVRWSHPIKVPKDPILSQRTLYWVHPSRGDRKVLASLFSGLVWHTCQTHITRNKACHSLWQSRREPMNVQFHCHKTCCKSSWRTNFWICNKHRFTLVLSID